MAHIRIGDELFNVAVSGPREAPVLLMSNSLGTDLRMWDPQMPELTKHFRVVRYDSRGHGASVAEPGPYTIEQLGRDAVAILDKLGIEKAHFVGLSKGGMVGQWLLAHAPGRILRAVLANTSSYMAMPDVWNARANTALAEGMSALATPTIERWFTREFRRRNEKIISDIKEMVARTPAEGYAACCLAIRDMDQRQAVRSIRKPVLVILGQHDPATPPAAGLALAESIPGARVVTLEAAHLSNIEAAPAFTNALIGFLTGKAIGDTVAPATPVAPPPVAVAAKSTPEPVRAAAKVQSSSKTKAAVKTSAASKPEKKAATRKPAAKKTAVKKIAVKKSAARTVKKAAVKSPSAKKASARKPLARRPVRKAAPKKPARKTVVKKSVAKKTVRKSAAKKQARARK